MKYIIYWPWYKQHDVTGTKNVFSCQIFNDIKALAIQHWKDEWLVYTELQAWEWHSHNYPNLCLEGLRITMKISLRIPSFQAEIWSFGVSTVKQVCYPLNQNVWHELKGNIHTSTNYCLIN
jgi:hypothetical protein